MACHSTPRAWAATFLFIIAYSQAAASVVPTPMAPATSLSYGNGGSRGELLCIGDSIRQGWAKYLPCSQPADNCGDTRNGLRSIDRWTGGRRWHVVVLNFGLHDIHHNISINEYTANLQAILHKIRAERIYFVLTSAGRPNNWIGRTPENVEKYNVAARWVCQKEHIPVIDLCAFTNAHREWWKSEADVHYTERGYVEMAGYIEQALIGPQA